MTDEQKRRVELLTRLTKRLGLTPTQFPVFGEVDARTPSRWRAGEGIVPAPLLMLLAVMARYRVTPDQARAIAKLDPIPEARPRGRPKTKEL